MLFSRSPFSARGGDGATSLKNQQCGGEPPPLLCSFRPPGRRVSLNSDSDNNAERHFVFICNLVDTNDSGFLARTKREFDF